MDAQWVAAQTDLAIHLSWQRTAWTWAGVAWALEAVILLALRRPHVRVSDIMGLSCVCARIACIWVQYCTWPLIRDDLQRLRYIERVMGKEEEEM